MSAEQTSGQWHYVWLSFADTTRPSGKQFTGGAVVPGLGVADAVATSWLLGCNPGGEAFGKPFITSEPLPRARVGVLLDRATVEAADEWLQPLMVQP